MLREKSEDLVVSCFAIVYRKLKWHSRGMSAKNHSRFAKMRRALTSIPTADLLAAILVVATIATIAVTLIGERRAPENAPLIWIVFKSVIVIAVILVVLLVIKTRLEYRRRTYNPSLAFEFDKMFNSLEDARSEAAKVCKSLLAVPGQSRNWEAIPEGDRVKVEPVLDFLEDLGFYLEGDQFSDEVIHHHFFHWIRGWYSNLESYVQYYREVRNQMAAYGHIKVLYARVSEIEKRHEKPQLWLATDQEKLAFLKEECDDKEIKLGMTIAEVENILGPPATKIDLGEKVLYKYKDMTVEFHDGKVTDVR